MKVLDRNHTGLISIQQIAKDPLLSSYLELTFLHTNNNTKSHNQESNREI